MRKMLILFLLTSALLVDTAHGRTHYSENLIADMARGFVKATQRESKKWWECGQPTPSTEWLARAERMARVLVAAMDEYGADFSPWGVWGVIWVESRGNRCAVGPNPRRYAAQKKLAQLPSKYFLWTEQDIKGLLTSPGWRGRPVDLGVGQVVWKRYARIPCEHRPAVYWSPLDGRATFVRTGPEACHIEGGREVRVPSLEEMISLEGGLRATVWGMVSRQSWSLKRNRTPWLYWKGMVADYQYLSMVVNVVANMGGPIREVVAGR